MVVWSKNINTYYQQSLEGLKRYSNDAFVFCLIHKMDLLDDSNRLQIFDKKQQEVTEISKLFKITCFQTQSGMKACIE